jgi:hypothetical protein
LPRAAPPRARIEQLGSAMRATDRRLVIACGALAAEIAALRRANGWSARSMSSACRRNCTIGLNALPGAVQEQIRAHRDRYAEIFVAYGDCGTGGALDAVLRDEGVERIAGAHCYEFFASPAVFAALAEAEPGSFYLTDFLLRHFDRLVIRGLGIDRHPHLLAVYFGNYRRLVYLAQAPTPEAESKAQAVAARLGLEYDCSARATATSGSTSLHSSTGPGLCNGKPDADLVA